MHAAIICKVLGLLLMLFSLTLAPPTVVALWYQDNGHFTFILAFVISFASGVSLWYPAHDATEELRTREGFLVTALFWVVLALSGSLPFLLSEATELSFTDAMFESLSGLTTTGATVLTGLDALPRSLLYYRQQLQWLGGIGIIVIAVAILPMLGVGGMQLFRAEVPGPVKDTKLTPRITETAKVLFFIYLGLTFACMFAYWLAGMSLFDAVGHAYSTVAIGGFSTHDASIGYFESPAVMLVAMVFMVLSGISFALHFTVWHLFSVRQYWRDPECRFYLAMIAFAVTATVAYLFCTETHLFSVSLLQGGFEAISILTTTGYSSTGYSVWPSFLPFFLFLFSFIGGCAHSTAGGIKVVRAMLIIKQALREIYRLIHPSAIVPIKLGSNTVNDRVIGAVWAFFAVYIVAYILMCLLLLASGLDFTTAFSAVGACLNNLGPGLGTVAHNYEEINSFAKWVLCFAMLLGRLEVFTLLVLFVPAFWRR